MPEPPTRPAGDRTHTLPDPNATAGGDVAPTGTPPPAPPDRYVLGDEIARSGMGVVYRATDAARVREVAVKVLADRFGPGSGAARRFGDEARITGQLQHPGIPPVHDLGTLADGRPFLAMKLIKGETLAELLAARPDPSHGLGRFVAAFEQVCHAVGYAHAHKVIRRDLKPANVMVGGFGEVQVMDWGLAKVLGSRSDPTDGPETTAAETEVRTARGDEPFTRAGAVLGTPAFMAPGQAVGAVDRVDARSDVFGLGGILCAVLTGKPPSVGGTSESVRQLAAMGKVGDAFARLDGCGAEPELVALCKRCLSPERADRPADAGEVAKAVADLRAAADERVRRAELERVRAEGEKAAADLRAAELRKRWRLRLALTAAVALLLLGGGAFAWWHDVQATNRRREAEDRVRRDDDVAAGLLAAADAALRAGDADRAATALDGAATRQRDLEHDLDDPAALDDRFPTLAARLDLLRTDLAVLRELDAIDRFRWTPTDNAFPKRAVVAERLRAALGTFGADPAAVPPAEAARRIAASVVQDRLVAALDRVFQTEPSDRVRAALRALDPHPYRDAVRDAVAAGDGKRVAELIADPAAAEQPPGFVSVLGEYPAVPVERRRELLEAAAGRRPREAGLLMTAGFTHPLNQRAGAEDRVRWFQAAAAADPNNPAAFNNLGSALRDNGDLDGAAVAFRETTRLAPGYAPAHHALGLVLWAKGDADGVVAAFREALRHDPKHAPAHTYLGLALQRRGDPDGAIAAFREAVRHDPNYAPAYHGLARALQARRDWDGAIGAYRELVRLHPNNAAAHSELGIVLREGGNLDGAIACFREAIRQNPRYALGHFNLGLNLQRKGEVTEAVACFRESLKLDPGYAPAHYSLGLILQDSGDVDGAIPSYRAAVRLDPKNATAHNNLGVALAAKGDLDAAVAAYDAAARLRPDSALYRQNLDIVRKQKAERDASRPVAPPPRPVGR